MKQKGQGKSGRPKGSSNKDKTQVNLTAELRLIRGMIEALLILIGTRIPLQYLLLDAQTLIKYYSLRFQIEFNFRDAKQFWGLEDFMNTSPTGVMNAANLSFLMVNLSFRLLQQMKFTAPDYSILDLKALNRGQIYVREVLKYLRSNSRPYFIAIYFYQCL